VRVTVSRYVPCVRTVSTTTTNGCAISEERSCSIQMFLVNASAQHKHIALVTAGVLRLLGFRERTLEETELPGLSRQRACDRHVRLAYQCGLFCCTQCFQSLPCGFVTLRYRV